MELIKTDIEKLMKKESYVNTNQYADKELNYSFNCFCFLENLSPMFHKMLNGDLETIFYSKYYWFTKYKNRYIKLYGKDAGIEQQQLKIIEEIEQEFGDIQWDLVERIENGQV